MTTDKKTRMLGQAPDSHHEQAVGLAEAADHDPARHAWPDPRVATNVLAEHGVILAPLMPEEMAEARFRDISTIFLAVAGATLAAHSPSPLPTRP
jgi:hypothetical protein